jgi:hypothetical protein
VSLNHPRITCAVCRKEVERVVVELLDYDAVVRLRVWCHGDTDKMQITGFDLARMGGKAIDDMVAAGGIAFSGAVTKELVR